MRSSCIVHGCTNDSDHGGMRNELLCIPCFDMLVAGAPQSPGDTFIHKLQKRLFEKLAETTGNQQR